MGTQWHDSDFAATGGLCQRDIVGTIRQGNDQVDSSLCRANVDGLIEFRAQTFDKRITSGPVDTPNPGEVPFEVAGLDKSRDGSCLMPRGMTVGGASGTGGWFDQPPWEHRVGEAGCRIQCLRERTQIDDVFMGSETCQWFEWLALQSQFAVIVIFNDNEIRVTCPLQQCQPSFKGHRNSRRILMGGRDERQSGYARFGQERGIQPHPVYGDTVNAGAFRVESAVKTRVAWFFDYDPLSRLHEQTAHQSQDVLYAARDEDLLGQAAN